MTVRGGVELSRTRTRRGSAVQSRELRAGRWPQLAVTQCGRQDIDSAIAIAIRDTNFSPPFGALPPTSYPFASHGRITLPRSRITFLPNSLPVCHPTHFRPQ